jgi:hypothetical protein
LGLGGRERVIIFEKKGFSEGDGFVEDCAVAHDSIGSHKWIADILFTAIGNLISGVSLHVDY